MTITILLSFALYLGLIFIITWFTDKGKSDNEQFFIAGRSTPWWVVSIGMIGDTISGVSFVSVPGMLQGSSMAYLQLCFGFLLGYIAVAYILLPLYYRLKVVSIYEYLALRFGPITYKTGASFFLISKLVGSAAKLYLISLILQTLAFAHIGIPYPLTVFALVAIIWLYTRKGGMGTIIWTDILQTVSLFGALCLIIWEVSSALSLDVRGICTLVQESSYNKVFEWSDWTSSTFFWKQLLSGAFIVVVMTGLDQNMMQKNLTCRTLKESQKNMLVYGSSFIPLNYLFLVLGILLLAYASSKGISLPEKGDEILPFLASNYLGKATLICFTIGITASSFSNADSALTSLTTSACIDILGLKTDEDNSAKTRNRVHLVICIIFAGLILFISQMQQSSVLDTIYTAVSYTYGPLLGLYAFGLLTKKSISDCYAPYVCILAPILSHLLKLGLKTLGYSTGYELLLINALLTIIGLLIIQNKKTYMSNSNK